MNKLIKVIFCILFVLAFGYKGFSQRVIRVPVRRIPIERMNRPPVTRRVELVKEDFIQRRLNFTPEESKAFWPVYRQYIQDQTAIRILKRENNSYTSPDGAKQIDLELQYETELVNIRKHYKDEFLKILPPEKVSKLYKCEREFNDEMVKILGERKAGS